MSSPSLPRRNFLAAAAGTMASLPLSACSQENAERSNTAQAQKTANRPMPDQFPVKAVASKNGLQATRRAYQQMQQGADPLDAAVAGVRLVEEDPEDVTVGYGGLPNEDGVVELDAAVMHGPTHQAGAVAALQNVKHASGVARLVMSRSDHVFLVGEGALRFARAHGFPEEDLLTERARKIWLYWKETLSQGDDWVPPPPDELDPDVAEFFRRYRGPSKSSSAKSSSKNEPNPRSGKEGDETSSRSPSDFPRPTGTIHCGAMNATGDLSCTTTTSGLAFKLPGRVGDSPIIGAGLYVDNDIGSCGSTGRGEANLQNLCCFAAVELMRGGRSPQEAGLEVLRRVAAHTEERLQDEAGRPDFGLKFYLLAKDGTHAGVSMWGPTQFAVTDENGSRLEQCAFLHERGTRNQEAGKPGREL